MGKRYLILFLALFIAAKCYLGDNVAIVPGEGYLSEVGHCVLKHKTNKEIKPYTKVNKSKIKVRYKASEVKFSLDTYVFRVKPVFHILEPVWSRELSFSEAGFQYIVKLRGPPAVV